MKKILYALIFSLLSSIIYAATTSTAINSSSYTQILGPGGNGYLLSAYQPMQCAFATTIPAPTVVGHTIQQQQQTSIDSIGSGVYLWCKSNAAGLNYATTTPVADAATWGNSVGGSGSTSDVNIKQVGGTTYALGQTTMSASMPVVLPSNQSAIPVTESGVWNITNVTGTVSLPTGAATAAKQPALGVAGTASTDVITVQGIAGGVVIPISAASLPLPSGAATNAGITGDGSKTLSDINTTLGSPLQAGGNVVVTSAPTTAVTNAGLTNIDVALSTRLKPADTLAAVTTVGTITNPVAVTGTFWQATQPVSGTVTANIGTSGSLALDASVTGLQVSQGSTTSGQKGQLIQGAVTTSAPTYTTAQTNPLSLDTSGNLRVVTTMGASGATAANQTTEIASLSTIATNSGTQATAANQTTGNTSLSTIATNTTGITVAQGSTTSGQSGQLMQAAVTTSAPTYSNGQTSPLNLTTGGGLRVSQTGTWTIQPGNTANTAPWLNTPTPVVSPLSSSAPNEASVSTAYEASHIVKSSAGVLYSLICYNSKASAQFVLTFNSTTLPADSTVSVTAPMSCQASSNCTLDFGDYGKYYSTGVVWSNSSTSPTKTIGSADMFCEPRYQ